MTEIKDKKKTRDKRKIILEIAGCYFLMMASVMLGRLEERLEADGLFAGMGFLTAILVYLLPAALLLFYVLKIEKAPLSSVGLQRICLRDISGGLMLGLVMFAAQQIPLLLMKMDYGMYAMPPEPGYIVVMSLYCILCVGMAEELVFRGFILPRTQTVCGSGILSVGINILFFYAIHCFSMQFTFGEFYSLAVNTVLLCVYFFRSKRRSIVPLILAHGFYDIMTSVLLPIFVFVLQR